MKPISSLKTYVMCYRKTKEQYPEHKLGQLTRHHRTPKSKGGTDLPNNISYVPEKLHNAYHLLFSTHLPHKVAQMLNDHWISNDVTMLVVPNEYLEKVRDYISKLSLSKY